MGSSDFSIPVLAALMEAGHSLACVYAQPPRPAGRGYHERPCPVHAFAAKKGLAVRTPKTLREVKEQEAFAALKADAAIVAAYGLILPKAVLDAPIRGCINVHASRLPRWRGAAPIQRAILAGDTQTGVTIMQMDEGLDTGPILLEDRLPITPETTASTLSSALSKMGARRMVEALEDLDKITPRPQPSEGAAYAKKLDKNQGRIDWTKDSDFLERSVRALNPWPGVWCKWADERLKVLAAETASGNAWPGTTLDDRLTVACGKGALRLTRVQKAGKAPMESDVFLRGNKVIAGERLG